MWYISKVFPFQKYIAFFFNEIVLGFEKPNLWICGIYIVVNQSLSVKFYPKKVDSKFAPGFPMKMKSGHQVDTACV